MTSHPLVTRARRLADDLLAPHAEQVDQEGVPASHIEAIKQSGLLGVSAPVAYGGSAAPAAVARETAEVLVGACCSTWFVQTQHHTPVLTLAKSELPCGSACWARWRAVNCSPAWRTPTCGRTPGPGTGHP